MDRIDHIRTALAAGPVPAGALCAGLGVTRPTLARALASMPGEIVTLGAARSTHYALRDNFRGLPDVPVYRVNAAGQIETLGQLTPVRPDGLELEAVAYQLSGRHIDDLDALRKWLPASNRVHQFQDGNGRLSRVLKTLLLIFLKLYLC